jgi:Protein of unknown function (DUF3987)
VALPALAVLGGMIGCKRQVAIKPGRGGWYETPVVWAVVVGRSGSTKSPAWAAAVEPVRDLERELHDQHKAAVVRHDPESDQPAPVCRRAIVADVTVEKLAVILQENPAGLLLARDELSGWAGSFNQYKAKGGSDLANWLEMHRAGPVRVDRINRPGVYVPCAAVSVCGTIQPDVLRSVLNEQNRAAGLGARLLLAKLPNVARVWSDVIIAPETFDAYAVVVRGLFDLHRADMPIAVPLDMDAKRLFVDFFNGWNREAADHGDDLAATWAKLEAYAPRFALIHHLAITFADLAPAPIGPESMTAGITLARWFGREAERVYAMLDTEEPADEQRLLDFIRGRGGRCTARDAMTWNRRRYPTAGDADAALRLLVKGGHGRFDRPASGPIGGHPATIFRLT